MAGRNQYLDSQRRAVRQGIQIGEATMAQFMLDTLMLTVSDPAVMGGDAFGKGRMARLVEGWEETMDQCWDALNKGPEADYIQAKMDRALRPLVDEEKRQWHPFSERYPYLMEADYGPGRGRSGGKKPGG